MFLDSLQGNAKLACWRILFLPAAYHLCDDNMIMIPRTIAKSVALLLLFTRVSLGTDGIVFAPSTQPSAPPLTLSSLQNVTLVSGFPKAVHVGAITAFPLNSPPVSGFIPQLIFGVTDQWNNATYQATASSIPGGNRLPLGSPKYFIATFDTGAQSHIIGYQDAQTLDLFSANRGGENEAEVVGASGSESVDISDGVGVYATGFSHGTVTGGAIAVDASPLSGHYNLSILTAQQGSSLPNILGTPLISNYQVSIFNSQPRHLTVSGKTYRTPEVTLGSHTTNPPTGYSKLSVTAVSPLEALGLITTPPSFFPDFFGLDYADNPILPTSWSSLMATVNGSHTAGSFSGAQFLFDTGAQVTVVSEATASLAGYYTGGENPSTPDFEVEVSGVGGSTSKVPGFYMNSLNINTTGGPVVWTHVPVLVLDLPDPAGSGGFVDGILGMNLFTDRDLIINASPFYIGISPQWQWNVASGGSWTNASNWSLALPNGMDTQANFYGKITSAQTITVNSDVTVGVMNFDNANRYTIAGPGRVTLQVSAEQAEIGVSNGSHTISAPMTFASDTNITVWQPASRLLISGDVTSTNKAIAKSGLGVLEMRNVRAGTLTVNAGTVAITAGGGTLGTSRVSHLVLDNGTFTTGHLDLADHSMIVDYVMSSPLSTIQGYLASGYNGGAWNGLGIDSSAADSLTHALGVADNSVLHLSTFGGLSVSANAVLIKFTWYGDANLDGMVTAQDLGMLATNWQQPTNGAWTGGDFNYDGRVDIRDLYLLAVNWQHGVGAPLGQSLGAALASFGLSTEAVPEPSTLGIFASIFIVATTRRIRRSNRL